jgi:hypothetical protein
MTDEDRDLLKRFVFEGEPRYIPASQHILFPEFDPDDSLLAETPPDVILALGRDPREEATEEEIENEVRAPA